MGNSVLLKCGGALLLAFFGGVNGCLADSIDISNSTSNYEEYSYGPGTGYTSPVDQFGFTDLGTTPGSFLFTANMMYAFNGTPEVGMIEVNPDPTEQTTQLSSSSLVGQSSQGTAPEPASFAMGAGALALYYVTRSRLVRAR